MGVQGLTNILIRYAPSAVRKIRANALSKQTIAFDASCHLNKFIYGEEQVAHRHIYGFYQLARFCQLNHITPIFVFDGPSRLPAKHLEHEKRARTRRKVKHSLLFERDQSTRLDAWSQLTMALTEDQTQECYPRLQPDIESKITLMAKELRQALAKTNNHEKYTRTVRALAVREDGLVTNMILHRLKEVQSSLKSLRKDNTTMTHSLGIYIIIFLVHSF